MATNPWRSGGVGSGTDTIEYFSSMIQGYNPKSMFDNAMADIGKLTKAETKRLEKDLRETNRQLKGAEKEAKIASNEAVSSAKSRYSWANYRYEDSRGYLRSILGDFPDIDAESIMKMAEDLTPRLDERAASVFDEATGMITDPTSSFRRMLDGDFDFTYFNQGVVEPMKAAHTEMLDDIVAQYSGGDAYGRAGGSGGRAARAAVAKANKGFSETIAGLRAQEYNNILNRSLQASGLLNEFMKTVDNRPYEQIGLNAALALKNTEADIWGNRLSGAAAMAGLDADLTKTGMNNLAGALGDRANRLENKASRYQDERMALTGDISDLQKAVLGARNALNISSREIASRDWTTNLERNFAEKQNTQQLGISNNLLLSSGVKRSGTSHMNIWGEMVSGSNPFSLL